MRTKLLAATALAGSLTIASWMWGAAQATPAPSAQATNSGLVTLIAQQGGGGGGGGGHVSGGGGGPAMAGGPRGGGRAMAERGGGREFSREGPRGRIDHGDRGRYVRDRDHRRYAGRDRDHNHDFDHRGRHRVFRNGVWVWVYGPDYYASDDCWWLQWRALATRSPYWWSRYNDCVGYY